MELTHGKTENSKDSQVSVRLFLILSRQKSTLDPIIATKVFKSKIQLNIF